MDDRAQPFGITGGDDVPETPRTPLLCKIRHAWREMTHKEAYPAPAGKICVRCDATRLRW
jgi:hypothetical protein